MRDDQNPARLGQRALQKTKGGLRGPPFLLGGCKRSTGQRFAVAESNDLETIFPKRRRVCPNFAISGVCHTPHFGYDSDGRAYCNHAAHRAIQTHMNSAKILTTASEMLEAYGDSAKFVAAEHIDRALQDGDGAAHDQWCMIGKAIALMSVPRPDAKAAGSKPVADKPAESITIGSRSFKAA
jgi:hypothetical protein